MWTQAINLVSPRRLDVFARTEYVKHRILNRSDVWSQYLYRTFIVDGSGADGSERENGVKSTFNDYLDQFNGVIDSIASSGFDPSYGSIPLSEGGIVNGAHRLAVALYLNLPVYVETSREQAGVYDYRWMFRRGLNPVAIDAMAFNLIRMMENCRATLLFDVELPTARKVEEAISETSEVVIRKRINLSDIGQRRIIDLAYGHNEWWSPGLLEQLTAERFPSGQNATCDVIFSLDRNVHDIRERKSELRKLLPTHTFERRLHGTDEYSDTLTLAESLLNRNSLHFLNHAPIGSENRIFEMLGGPINSKSPLSSTRDWVIDGSSVLEIHGIRQARDLDFVACSDVSVPNTVVRNGESHSDQYLWMDFCVDDIINDPRRHLLHRGVKFLSLDSYFLLKSLSSDVRWRDDLTLTLEKMSVNLDVYQARPQELASRRTKWLFLFGVFLDRQLRRLPRGLEKRLRRLVARMRNPTY